MKRIKPILTDDERLKIIVEAVLYCQRVRAMGLNVAGYTPVIREAIYYAWTRRLGQKEQSARYRSPAAVGIKFGKRKLQYDHAVPYHNERDVLMDLTQVTPETVRLVLEKYDVCAIITQEENRRLNDAGLNHDMPPDWDKIDPLARYKAVGIEIIDNPMASQAAAGKH